MFTIDKQPYQHTMARVTGVWEHGFVLSLVCSSMDSMLKLVWEGGLRVV
jgi:hypothetical protein